MRPESHCLTCKQYNEIAKIKYTWIYLSSVILLDSYCFTFYAQYYVFVVIENIQYFSMITTNNNKKSIKLMDGQIQWGNKRKLNETRNFFIDFISFIAFI